jgi:DNA-binding MarR family transcriptional regulator
MTNRVDRLVARGFVERLPDPHDRRGVLVRLTDTGRETVDGALAGLLEQERDLLSALTPAEVRQLAGLMRRLAVSVEPAD